MPDNSTLDAWEQINALQATLPLPSPPGACIITDIPYPFEPGPTPFPAQPVVEYKRARALLGKHANEATHETVERELLDLVGAASKTAISDEDVKRIANAVVESIINDDRVGFAISQAIREERKLRKIARRARRKDRERRKSR